MHFQDIIFQERPAADHAGQILTLLQDPGRLFLIKGSNRSKPTSNQDSTVMCVYTATPKMFSNHLLSPGAWRDSCVVFSLSPAHIVYHPTQQHDTDSNLEIREEFDGLSLGVGSLKLRLTDGLRLLKVENGSSAFENNVEALEIWTIGIDYVK